MEFECIQCGKCCRWPGFVWLTNEDIERLSENLSNGDIIDFTDTYVSYDGPRSTEKRPVLRNKPGTEECVFLGNDNRCTIHDIKPEQCKKYPLEYDPECPGFEENKEKKMSEAAEKVVRNVMAKFSSDEDFEKKVVNNLYAGLQKQASEKVVENAMRDGIGNFLADNRRVKIASLDDLFSYNRVSKDTLIHKSTKDLWTIEADDEGDVHITRLFESGKPVKG